MEIVSNLSNLEEGHLLGKQREERLFAVYGWVSEKICKQAVVEMIKR
jgi:hypothetical protein